MTLLFIGGMLIVALLAVLGAVYLSVSDQRTQKGRANGSVSVSPTISTPLVEQPTAASSATERTTPPGQNLPQRAEGSLRTTGDGQQPYTLNGQFHELTVELQTLYQHAWELERRLRTLADVANRIENTQSDQIGNEEEIRRQPSADTALS